MDQLAGFDFALVYWVARMVASFFAYSFAGWLFEVIISLFQHHRFVDRGFSFGPVCPIYGVGALLAVLFLSHLTDPPSFSLWWGSLPRVSLSFRPLG